MQITPNNNSGPVGRTYWKSSSPAPAPKATDSAQFESAAALNRALEDTPDVRASEIQRARQLISDPSYPSAQTIKRIATTLATNIGDPAEDA